MASKKKPKDEPAPAFFTVEDIARARGVDPATVRTNVYLQRKAEAAAGQWPYTGIPKPDRGRPLLGWRTDRPEVVEYMRSGGSAYPNLWDRDWLIEHYVTRGLSVYAIARQEGCTKDAVTNALIRAEIPLRPGSQSRALQDVLLVDLEAAIVRGGIVGAAGEYDVTESTLTRALRIKRAEAAAAGAVDATV